MIIFAAATLMILALVLIYGVMIEPFRIKTVFRSFESEYLHDDITVLHLSDFHFRKGSGRKVKKLKQALEKLPPYDFVMFSGDFLERQDGLEWVRELLKNLAPRYGMFSVRGNHEHYEYTFYHLFAPNVYEGKKKDTSALEKLLKEFGVKMLENENQTVETERDQIVVTGVGDYYTRNADLKKALQGIPDKGYRIMLTHSPEIIKELPETRVDLFLAGHTHGGQIRLPFYGGIASRSSLPRKMINGYYRWKGMPALVSNGIGEGFFVRMRFLSPPEILLIKIEPKKKDSPTANKKWNKDSDKGH